MRDPRPVTRRGNRGGRQVRERRDRDGWPPAAESHTWSDSRVAPGPPIAVDARTATHSVARCVVCSRLILAGQRYAELTGGRGPVHVSQCCAAAAAAQQPPATVHRR